MKKTSRTLGKFFLLISCFLVATSCVSKKKMIYFQNSKNPSTMKYFPDENIKVQVGDLLTIRVSSEEQDAAQPFNLTKSIARADRMPGVVELETYMVSSGGTIEFPVVGSIKVEGLTTFELSDKIKQEISAYVTDAIVNVRVLNFRISILGEVKNPGTFTIEDDHISLPKALGMAGDLTIFGRRDNVLVMREQNGEKVEAYLDITDENVITSPFYNLRQNDVVYIEPKVARVQSASALGVASSYLSIASVIISLVILLTQ